MPAEQLEGLLYACHGKLSKVEGYSGVIRTDIADQQVVVVTGGGSGHEPMFAGFVGKGLADAAALGEILLHLLQILLSKRLKPHKRSRCSFRLW